MPVPADIERIADTLPSGFHDAGWTALHIHDSEHRISLELTIDMTEDGDREDSFRRGVLTFSHVTWYALQSDRGELPKITNMDLRSDIEVGRPRTADVTLPDGVAWNDVVWIYGSIPWNGLLYVVADEVSFAWSDVEVH